MLVNQTPTKKSSLVKTVLAFSVVLPLSLSATSVAFGGITNCKINVVGGSYKGRSFDVKMKDGEFTNVSGMTQSNLPGCRTKKKVFGRWYHLCTKGTLIVYKYKSFQWVRLQPKSLLKYEHTCF